MKIKEIVPEFELDSDIDAETAVKLYRAVIMSGKQDPNLSDYNACPLCGATPLYLYELRKQESGDKAVILQCNQCKWKKIDKEWDYLEENVKESILAKYGKPHVVVE